MQQECVVSNLKKGLVYVNLPKKDACSGCNACSFAKNAPLAVPAVAKVECKIGDTVRVELPKTQSGLGLLVAYLLPIFALFAGYFAARFLFENQIIHAVGALIFCAVSFFPVYLMDKKFRKKYMPVVIEVIKARQDIKENV